MIHPNQLRLGNFIQYETNEIYIVKGHHLVQDIDGDYEFLRHWCSY